MNIREEVVKSYFLKKRFFSLKFKGVSMLPLISPGNEVKIELRKKAKKIALGEIVLFFVKRNFYAHRVIKKYLEKNGNCIYLTKGDNNKYLDRAKAQEEIFGKVRSIKKDNKEIDLKRGIWRAIDTYLFLRSKICWEINYFIEISFRRLKKLR